jgi:glucosylceramidase
VSLTPSVAAMLDSIAPADRAMIIDEYFNPAKGGMNLVRLPIGTCDFALNDYSYQDTAGAAFSIQPDVDSGLLQLVLDAQAAAGGAGRIKFISSTWSAPPWMKSNNSYIGGTLNSSSFQAFADYITNYVQAYADEGIPIWGVTPQNEPQHMGQFPTMGFPGGESGHTTLIAENLGPTLKTAFPEIKIIGFDHNRGSSLVSWATSVNNNATARQYTDGMANHWYGNTWDPGEASLESVHALNPDWMQIATEQGLSAINTIEIAEAAWMNDTWFWTRTSNDWGTAGDPTNHPIVVGMFRYAEDIIATFNHWQQGWIQWNAVTDKYGGPSHGENPEMAVKAQSPFMVDVCGQQPCAGAAFGVRGTLAVFKVPTLYVLEHFAKFFLPEGTVLETTISPDPPDYAVNPVQSPAAIRPSVAAVATENPDGSIAVNILNMNEAPVEYQIVLPDGTIVETTISAKALQTVLVN